MAKSQVSMRLPDNYREEIENYAEAEGLDADAEAARQLLRRGIDDYHDRRHTGRWLVRKGTEIAALGAVFGAVFAVTVAPGLWPAVVGFVTVTGIFAALWAGVLALEGELL